MRTILGAMLLCNGTILMAADVVPPPPYFEKAEGVVMTSIASSVPATLVAGKLGECKVLNLSSVIHTCDVTGASLTIGTEQTIRITRTQIIQVPSDYETKKPAVIYWFVGEASMPEGAGARMVFTKHQGQKRMLGDVDLMNIGAKSALVLEMSGQ